MKQIQSKILNAVAKPRSNLILYIEKLTCLKHIPVLQKTVFLHIFRAHIFRV